MTQTSMDDGGGSGLTQDAPLEIRITAVGDQLAATIGDVLGALPRRDSGPQALATQLGIDKVLASRVLKANRTKDPIAVTHLMPGPDPLRRVLRAASRNDVAPALIAAAERAVDEFERLIQKEIGDRSSLDAIISAWVPEARREFELRRKQSAFKSISQLKGVMADVLIATVFLHPSDDGTNLDIVWLQGVTGLHRLRPDVGVKFATRRMVPESNDRQPRTLSGEPIVGLDHARLDDFCSIPLPRLNVERAGEVVHYTLAGNRFGPNSAVDLFSSEVNMNELPRTVPAGSGRKAHMFAEVSTPVKLLQFDVILHEDVYPESVPALRLYDTALDGIADVNDPARDIDLLDMAESIEPLGDGVMRFRSSDVGRYSEMMRHVFASMEWDDAAFRGYRCRITYPLYGTQVAMVFDPPSG